MKMTELEELFFDAVGMQSPHRIDSAMAAYEAKKAAPEPTCKWTELKNGHYEVGHGGYKWAGSARKFCEDCGLPIEAVPYVEMEEVGG